MRFEPHTNEDVYCYLKTELEPQFQVTSEPDLGYQKADRYCYRVSQGTAVLREFAGDFSMTSSGALLKEAQQFVADLSTETDDSPLTTQHHPERAVPFASRQPPSRYPITWFSSGRAAFAFLIGEIARPRVIHLPTFVCWSLVDVMLRQFPEITLQFYPTTIPAASSHEPDSGRLHSDYPTDLPPDEVVLVIHYFGQLTPSSADGHPVRIEDYSHVISAPFRSLTETRPHEAYVFGSLRKTFQVADGGFVGGFHNVMYESDQHSDAWLRHAARDWRDLREAENMLDRRWNFSDISSQSLTEILRSDTDWISEQRQQRHDFLELNFPAGRSLMQFAADECPLLHCRIFETTSERDDLRAFLAMRGFFTSIHWPMHPFIRTYAETADLRSAEQMQNLSLSIPVSETLPLSAYERLCSTVQRWQGHGGARFQTEAPFVSQQENLL